MKVTRIIGLLTLAASLALAACGGGGAPTTALPAAAPTSSADAYTGPAPATADVQAFEVNFWNNVRVQNRCGQCHNATTPAQMPNFARSDNVNLAYAQANTVVNLAQSVDLDHRHQGERRPQLLARGQQRLRPHLDHLDQQLGRCHRSGLRHDGAIDRAAGAVGRPELELPGGRHRLPEHRLYAHQQVLRALPFLDRGRHAAIAVLRRSADRDRLSGRDSEDRFHRLHARSTTFATTCGTNSRFYQRLLTDKHNCWTDCASDAALMLASNPGVRSDADADQHRSDAGHQQGARRSTQGTIASGASRYDADTIAKYEFQNRHGNGRLRYERHRSLGGPHDHRQRDLGRRLGHQSWAPAARRRRRPRRAPSSTRSSRRPASSRSRPGSHPRWWPSTSPTWSATRAATPRATSRLVRRTRTMTSCCAARIRTSTA